MERHAFLQFVGLYDLQRIEFVDLSELIFQRIPLSCGRSREGRWRGPWCTVPPRW